ncbi:MAG: SMI1/KNR4 family protein [Myxococcales bacterium]|nr:SMI1/KNR4 family protein [Myxococcales bacterium]MDD9967018.1 SMI1/KNR4 family protein [Myxococcales bacterium]
MTDALWRDWEALWASARKAVLQLGAECEPAQVAPPAELREVERVEADLGRPLPQSLRAVVLGFSRKVSFRWQLPDDTERPEEFAEIFAGEVGWNLGELVELERSRKGWIEACFPDAQNEYDAIWHGKLAFFSIANGDMLAIDEVIDGSPVIYLSHDDGDGHGQALGANFADFVTRYSRLGCPGAEDWQWLPFHTCQHGSLLDPDSASAQRWQSWFGLPSV